MAEQLQRVTKATKDVLYVLLEDPSAEYYGFSIAEKSGYQSGTVYPILNRLSDLGWVHTYWETDRPLGVSGPPRKFYKLTKEGRRLALRYFRTATSEHIQTGPKFKYGSPIRIRTREEHGYIGQTVTLGICKCDVEVDPNFPSNIKFPFIALTDMDDQDPIQVEKVIINNRDFTGNIDLQDDKIIFDLIKEKKTFNKSISIASNIFGPTTSLEIEIAVVLRHPPNNKYQSIQVDIPYRTDDLSLELESTDREIAPRKVDSFSGEETDLVSARLPVFDILDLRDSETLSKSVSHKKNKVVWKPKRVKLGYSYFLNTELRDKNSTSSY